MPENILKVFKRDSSEVSFKMLFDTKKKKKKAATTKSANQLFPLSMKTWITSY